MRILLLREYGGRGEWRRQGRYATSVLEKTAAFIEVKPFKVHQSNHTCILLAAWIPPKKSRE